MGLKMTYTNSARRNVSPEQWFADLERDALGLATQQLQQRADKIRCPTHGKAARVHYAGKHGDRLSYDIEACCAAHRDRVTSALG